MHYKAATLGIQPCFGASFHYNRKRCSFVRCDQVPNESISMLEAASEALAKVPLSLSFASGIVGRIDVEEGYSNAFNVLIGRHA